MYIYFLEPRYTLRHLMCFKVKIGVDKHIAFKVNEIKSRILRKVNILRKYINQPVQ